MAMSYETLCKFETLMNYLPDTTYTRRTLWQAIEEANRLARKETPIPSAYMTHLLSSDMTRLVPSDALIDKYFAEYFIEVGYYRNLDICLDDDWDGYNYWPDEDERLELLYNPENYNVWHESYIRRKDTKLTEAIIKRYTDDELESIAHDFVHYCYLGDEHVTPEYIQFLRSIYNE